MNFPTFAGHDVEFFAGDEHLAQTVLRRQTGGSLRGERRLDVGRDVAFMAALGPDGRRRDLVYLPVEGEPLRPVGRPNGIDDVVEIGVRLLDGNAERGVLMGGHPPSDAEMQAAAAQEDVEHGELAGQPHRIPPRGHDHRRAHIHPLGPARPVRQPLQRIGLHRVRRTVMLGGPDRIEAEGLDQLAARDRVLHVDVVRDLRRAVVVLRHEPRPIPLVVTGNHYAAVHVILRRLASIRRR